jgi:hypothetical protein
MLLISRDKYKDISINKLKNSDINQKLLSLPCLLLTLNPTETDP